MKIISFVLLALSLSSLAQAAGFEKAVLWSGKEGGLANSGMSRITSSESLYFNPAGLAGGPGADFVLNVSPTSLKLEGPIASSSVRETTDDNYSTIGSAFAKYKITDQIGLGVGAYLAGGSKAIYENVSLTPDQSAVTSLAPTIRTELKVIEYSVGAAMELVPGLRLGAAWRISQVEGGFSTLKKRSPTATFYTFVDVTDAKQTKYDGFRLGLQYENPEKTWGVGASYRSAVDFVATGTGTGKLTIIPSNTTSDATVGETKLGTELPWALSVGGNFLLADSFRVFVAQDLTRYSRNRELVVTGTYTTATTGTLTLPNIPLNWKDMYVTRVGGEYTGFQAMALRAGYARTSRTTPKNDARATLSPPGVGHTFTVGAGKTFAQERFGLDGAFEYASTKGSGTMTRTGDNPTPTTKELLAGADGEYKARNLAFHLGASYRF